MSLFGSVRWQKIGDRKMGSILWILLVGACAGWLAGQFLKGGSSGLVTNMIVGVIGAGIGSILFKLVGLSAQGLIGEIIMATVGAIVLLLVLRKIRR
jgi:uncharacterized membrane protein YeaQ/YmgE (transglycosylase-associated protein family)